MSLTNIVIVEYLDGKITNIFKALGGNIDNDKKLTLNNVEIFDVINNVSYKQKLKELHLKNISKNEIKTKIDNDKTTFWQSNYNVYYPPPGYNGSAYLGNPDYKGEWFYLKLPKQINLVQYSLGFAGQGPSLWKIYGSNDGVKWTEIVEAAQNIPINANSFINNNYVRLS